MVIDPKNGPFPILFFRLMTFLDLISNFASKLCPDFGSTTIDKNFLINDRNYKSILLTQQGKFSFTLHLRVNIVNMNSNLVLNIRDCHIFQ